MAGRSSSRREFSIPGDELELHRIQLEKNLQNTDLSLHLSSAPDDDLGDNESLEYPRHGSAPEHFPAFASFDRHSRDNLDLDSNQVPPWSIHDDEGIAPYDVRTMSTAAHHASAITVTTGLARGNTREPSVSGAEYDPERPLQDIVAACSANADAANADRSQYIPRPRPKLSETLQRVGFSPKRPRGNQPGALHGSHGILDPSQRQTDTNISRRNMTPRTRKTMVSFDTTPASGSRFTKMARGLVRDVRQAQEEWKEEPPLSTGNHRGALKYGTTGNAVDITGELNHEGRLGKKSPRSRVHLPDITGLSNAVISPEKVNLERYTVRGASSKEIEARLVASLNALHTRLNHLETENSIARRRVRELEHELEECKRDVLRERTRIMESQDTADLSAARVTGPSMSRSKGKERRHKDSDLHASKYLEVVQEKKALEVLITTLRSHLSRVTSDLSSQQHMLQELRRLRESDARSLTEKTKEINELRKEVERLAGEIEVLRGVVEEGLNERRQGRDRSQSEERSHLVDTPVADPNPLVKSPDASVTSVRRFINDEEVDRISVDLDERRSERASNSSGQSFHMGDEVPSDKDCVNTRSRRRVQDPDTKRDVCADINPPFPRINSERMQRLFFSAPRHDSTSCRMCKGSRLHCKRARHVNHDAENDHQEDKDEGFDNGIEVLSQTDHRHVGRIHPIEELLQRLDADWDILRPGDVPPQTILARVIGELEDEFAHFREIYDALAKEYKSLDCATQTAKRHAVGDNLRHVIEVLECKGNQIVSLYDLLTYRDKSVE